ncbi:MAG: hypothetical protein ABH887_01100 [bacterium]
MSVNFLSSKKQELEKLLDIYDEYQWFIDNDFPIFLPKFYNKLYLQTKDNKKEFKEKLILEFNKIYDKNIYQEKKEIAKNQWQKVEKDFFNVLIKLGLKLEKDYFCYISLYGPEGQFYYPETINIRILIDKDIKEVGVTIAHEIIHLAIFNKVQKLKLSYDQIEEIVDLFFTETKLKNIFPDYKLQNIAVHDKKLLEEILI